MFYDVFVERVRRDPERARAWVAALAADAQPVIDNPGSYAWHQEDTRAIQLLIEARREMRHPFDAWRNRQIRMEARYRDYSASANLGLALRISPAEALAAMERLPTLDLVDLSMMAAHEDRALIEEMIAGAPPVFDANGQWLPDRNVTALFAIEQIVKHALKLDNMLGQEAWQTENRKNAASDAVAAARAARAEAREKELPEWMRHAFRLLLARPDGRELAAGYLAQLAHEVLNGHHRAYDGQWSVAACALDALASVLRDGGIKMAELRGAWQRDEARAKEKSDREGARRRVTRTRPHRRGPLDGEGARALHGDGLPWLIGAAHALGSDPQDGDELTAFWSWLSELFIGRDRALSFAFHDEASLIDVTQRFGLLLSRLPDFGEQLRTLYKRMEPQRRRSIHAFRYEGIDPDDPSVLLIRIGLYSIDYSPGVSRETSPARGQRGGATTQADHEELFFWLFDAARRLWLTAVLDTSERKAALVPLFFAYAPHIFGDRLPEALRRMVPPIANDAAQLGQAAWFLWQNHKPRDAAIVAQRIREAGADLEAALRDHHQWAELTRRRDFPGHESAFPHESRSLAEALGVELDALPPPPKGPTDITRLRQVLLRSIPWGAALLARLDEARCTLTHLWQLDVRGHTWGIQIDLPIELQRDAGLAPALRLLAARGAVRGGALRQVLEDPVGLDRVDADAIVLAGDDPRLTERAPLLAGSWGQRIAWPFESGSFAPFIETLHRGLRAADVFDRRDPVPRRALVGREEDIERLCAALAQGRAVGLFGLRKVGKTSLLRAVAEELDPVGARLDSPNEQTGAGEAAHDKLVVLLDIQSLTDRTLDGVAEQLARRLKRRLEHLSSPASITPLESSARQEGSVVIRGAAAASPMQALSDVQARGDAEEEDESSGEGRVTPPLADLDTLIARAVQNGTTCFLIDEYDLLFEGYGGEPGVAGIERLFALLRSRAESTGRVSLALVGRDPAFAERPLLHGFTNPLLGWVMTQWLAPLTEEDATVLLRDLGRRVGLDIGPETIKAAFHWTGGHPLLLRQLGAAAHEVAETLSPRPWPIATDALLEHIERRFRARSMVETTCGEIRSLLSSRFPDAHRLLVDIASVPEGEIETALLSHGGDDTSAARTLSSFGVLLRAPQPWIPRLFRSAFARGVLKAGRER